MLKIGYIKSIKGEISAKEQTKALDVYGCILENIHNGDKGETILDVIASLRDPKDEIVIYSGAVIGRPQFKKLLKAMGKIENVIYNVKADRRISFFEGDDIATLLDDIERAEIRTGGQGGKPNSIGIQAHKRILDMAAKGFNSREITEALNKTSKNKVYEKTTVWRYTKKPLANQRAQKCKS